MSGRITLFSICFVLTYLLIISGCGETVTEPEDSTVELNGTVLIEGGGDPSLVTVRIFEAPEDAQIIQTLNTYPNVGFSQYSGMLFDPVAFNPIDITNPNAEGEFRFDGLNSGSYIVDAVFQDFACPSPAYTYLSSNLNIGTLPLSPLHDINGYVAENVTWYDGEVYHITDDLIILIGYTLTIEGGALVLFEDRCAIEVFGSLRVDGTPANPAVFRLIETENANDDEWGGIIIKPDSGPCEIVGAAIHNTSTAIEIREGTAEISECLIRDASDFGVYFEADANGSVRHSIIVDGYTGITSRLSGPEFANNLILRMLGQGIVVNDSSVANINHNVLLDCQIGIFSDWHTEPSITYNLIEGGNIGIYAEEGFIATIQYNELRGQNEHGIYFTVGECYPDPFEYNNFIDMPWTILYVYGGAGLQADTVFAPYNYWDGESAVNIPNRIKDGSDHVTPPINPIGPVVFNPPLTEPVTWAGP